MAISQVSDLSGMYNNIYEDAIFVAREFNLMSQLVTGYSATGFMTRTLPIYPQLTAQVKAEGVALNNPQTWTKTSEMVLTPQTIMAQTVLTDERMETDPDGAKADASRELGGAIGTKIDVDLVGLFDNFDATKGTANNALTIAIVGAGIAVLRNNLALGQQYVVLHPYHWHDIWTLLGQPAAQQALLGDVANQALKDYFVGRYLAAQWFVSANISVDGSDDAYSAVFVRDALALDTRRAPTMEVDRDIDLLADKVNMHAAYAVGVRQGDKGVGIIADATEPT